jgi:enediyne biosynthesis protein E4
VQPLFIIIFHAVKYNINIHRIKHTIIHLHRWFRLNKKPLKEFRLMNSWRYIRAFVFTSILCSQLIVSAQVKPLFKFKDVARTTGIMPAAANINGHGAAWGDIDGDGWLDLYVGTFDKGGQPNLLFKNQQGKFSLSSQKAVQISTRTTGVVFADLDNDGDPDLYIGSMPQPKVAGNSLFENTGKGNFKNISASNGACPSAFGGRSVAVMDFDGDGLPDLLAGEDPVKGYNGSSTRSTRLFRNKGDLQFEDVSTKAGLPPGIPGLGVAAGDVNNDGWPDFFVASNDGGNRLFINDKKGRFYEAPGTEKIFEWKGAGGDNMVCGVTFGDLNMDGFADIILAPHFEEPWVKPQPLRLFLNKGLHGVDPLFEEITTEAGLQPIPMKAPHVEIRDFDNDGLPDIYTSVVKFNNGNVYPLIYKNTGISKGRPHFTQDAMTVNDFPDQQDKSFAGNKAPFFAKLLRENKIIYSAAGPVADFDNDGKPDIFLPSWWPEKPSLLLHNETPGGNWLDVTVTGKGKVNRMGIGTVIRVYPAGKAGQKNAMLSAREVSMGFGYASGQPAIVHFGLGKHTLVDLEIILPHGNGTLIRTNVQANKRVIVSQ